VKLQRQNIQKNGKDGTPESHARNDGRNESRPRKMTARFEAKADANYKEMKGEMKEVMKAQMASFVSWMDIHQEKMEAAIHVLRAWRREMMACQEMMEAHLECKEPTSEDMESEAEHWEVPKEHATVETGRAPNKWHRDWHLDKKCSQKPKERTRGSCRSQKKLTTKGTQKGRMEEERCWQDPECKMGIKDPDAIRQLHLKIERTADGFDRRLLDWSS
jgi:hypothetical protein